MRAWHAWKMTARLFLGAAGKGRRHEGTRQRKVANGTKRHMMALPAASLQQ
ncbi:hypothetical protein BRADI_3g25668v3 [Brachypodium distachyon]|uniref:Uncharacterized protein n=1 Tax=Brachypodium distachyon TaxID=15368 RepID=A0A2K2CZ98_BRADI|nr:hypothetical protein BRADI_3g25668v3 [Brachypodium distachyon]